MFATVIRRSRWRTAAVGTGLAAIAFLVLQFPDAVAGGVRRGLSLCASVMIPSLFPFLVLGGVLVRSGVAAALGRRLEPATRWLFGLPGCCAAGILIAFVGGYPAGGMVIAELVRSGQLQKDDGRRMLRFCVNGGPGFVIGAVGAELMNNAAFGAVLFGAQLVASLILGVACAPRRRPATKISAPVAPRSSLPTALAQAVTAACHSLLSLCGFVVLFAAVSALFDTVGIGDNPVLFALLSCLLEVNGGCAAAAEITAAAPLLLGFAVGFGGLSVHCQLADILHGTGVMSVSFMVSRAAHGALTAVLTVLFLQFIPIPLSVGAPFDTPLTVQASYGGAAVSAAMLLLCGVWMLSVSPSLDKEHGGRYNK